MNRNNEIAVLVSALALSACSVGSGPSAGTVNYLTSLPSSSGSTSTNSGSGTTASGSYRIGGTVTGLNGSDLTLQLNDGAVLPVAANGAFSFPTALPTGTAYTVSVTTQPSVSREICGVSGGTGTVSTANITNVTVNCSTVIGFLYQLGPSQIYAYGISAVTGLPIAFGQPIATGPAPTAITVASGGNYLYVTDSNVTDSNPSGLPGSLSIFTVNSDTGKLTPVGSPIAAGRGAGETAVSSSGYLFVHNSDIGAVDPLTPDGPQTLAEYAVDPLRGTLSLIGTVMSFPSTAELSFAVAPNGRFLYVLTGAPELNTNPIPLTLTVYAIDPATGALTAGSSITPGGQVSALTIDPLGRFLYLLNSQASTDIEASSLVLTYAIDSSSGALATIGTGTVVASNGAGLAADPTGRYLYSINALNFDDDNNIQALRVDPSTGSVDTIGSPMATPGQPFPTVGASPVACDPSGQFVYLQSGYPSTGVLLTTFSISTSPDTPGQLIPSGPSQPAAGEGGGAIAIIE